ncbi:hypothetical protein LptCag_1004 [Leptospirillum ferriphilum]|uniref:Uncharacterized protein n=1 Tax=Leptospirillum ferriphilum TaxID=178606 RepID=A0A094YLX9_9BACT|nr:hypothetical protein LptCag_1004 [Leptospirillum ferriphilum]
MCHFHKLNKNIEIFIWPRVRYDVCLSKSAFVVLSLTKLFSSWGGL